MAKKTKSPINVYFKIDGVRYTDPPEWYKQHIADVMSGTKKKQYTA